MVCIFSSLSPLLNKDGLCLFLSHCSPAWLLSSAKTAHVFVWFLLTAAFPNPLSSPPWVWSPPPSRRLQLPPPSRLEPAFKWSISGSCLLDYHSITALPDHAFVCFELLYELNSSFYFLIWLVCHVNGGSTPSLSSQQKKKYQFLLLTIDSIPLEEVGSPDEEEEQHQEEDKAARLIWDNFYFSLKG